MTSSSDLTRGGLKNLGAASKTRLCDLPLETRYGVALGVLKVIAVNPHIVASRVAEQTVARLEHVQPERQRRRPKKSQQPTKTPAKRKGKGSK